jgi:hypothetical protein
MARRPIEVPNRSYDDLRRIADQFLRQHHPRGTIPVPIEQIIELQLHLDIIPTPNLFKHFDIHAYVSKDMTGIWVDRDILEDNPRGYNYSLAHELSHVLIHPDLINGFEFENVEEWKDIITSIDEKLYAEFEWQAHALARLILVPREALALEFKEAEAKLPRGLSLESLSETGRFYIVSNLARRFGVLDFAMEDRIKRDRLWPDR